MGGMGKIINHLALKGGVCALRIQSKRKTQKKKNMRKISGDVTE
jgi:hypothetical protein